MFKNIDWPCEIFLKYHIKNLGCKNAVEQGITWFFENEDEGIILEDDCLPSNSFFIFMDELLCKYRNDREVLMISGTNHLGEFDNNGYSYFYCLGDIWGWATWKRAWILYDKNLENLDNNIKIKSAIKFCKKIPWVIKEILKGCRKVRRGEISSWAYPWALTRLVENGLSIAPSQNLVENIGYGPDATNTILPKQEILNKSFEIKFPLKHPIEKKLKNNYYLIIKINYFLKIFFTRILKFEK
jgi:uncharacterized protein (DUF2132 family)